MIRTFTVETDQPDSNGDVIVLSGIQFGSKIHCFHNFNRICVVALNCELRIEGNEVKCTVDLDDEHLDLYPAIGFSPISYVDKGSHRIFEEIKLYQIGLCDKPNANPTIKTIREQLKGKE